MSVVVDENLRPVLRGYIASKTGDKIFSVLFFKKTDELRQMVCRFGFNYKAFGRRAPLGPPYFYVWDMQKNDIRPVNTETVISFKCRGKIYLMSDAERVISEHTKGAGK